MRRLHQVCGRVMRNKWGSYQVVKPMLVPCLHSGTPCKGEVLIWASTAMAPAGPRLEAYSGKQLNKAGARLLAKRGKGNQVPKFQGPPSEEE